MASNQYGSYSSMFGSSDPYLSSWSRYRKPNPLASTSFEVSKYSSSSLDLESSIYSNRSSVGGGIDYDGIGLKRSSEALYHQNVPGSHNTIGQNDALFYSNSMFKHLRLETPSSLPVYPRRPGEKVCTHYMLTRTCMFGEACKFDHPIWVPEGGIPDWKEVPPVPATGFLPVRPGEPDCPYYIKTQKCNFGFLCKFNHPKDKLTASRVGGDGVGAGFIDNLLLPERPSEPICVFYSKTGKCKFGMNCKFHHPKDIQIPSNGRSAATTNLAGSALKNSGAAEVASGPAKTFIPVTPALLHNSKGLPIRPGETDCPFFLKTGSCKYGANCRYSHPERSSINPPLTENIGQTIMPSGTSLPTGLFNPKANFIPSFDPLFAQASLGVSLTMYPQRPGQLECDFYMKTGRCNFGERCKFHHPVDRSAPRAFMTQAQPNVKITLAGLPRREGSTLCAFYMKTGACKYGVSCRFDHPPPGEAVAMATAQGVGGSAYEVDATGGGDEADAAKC